ncbi:hypothetical protein WN51_11704 [Melipona quadrifasciata]|uniref:Uncharacterized protein n=1 Tax=Melipona quadrifasciata TaxID=166423 RepID=A0A0M9A5I4_9HYME|nr:hypothetical protein WN51_11704 [Melipona quadrifasciata]
MGGCVKACVAAEKKRDAKRRKENGQKAKVEGNAEENENKGERLNVATTCNFAKYQNNRMR